MTTTNHESAGVHAGRALPTASDIRNIIEGKKKDKLAEENRFRKAAEEKLAEQKKAFDARKLTPESIDRVMSRIRRAAENGEYDVLVGQFPSEWCSDGGRSINVREEGWHETLPSFAREFFEFWQHELKPRGFRLSAQIVSFKAGGLPGDVGAYLSWKA